MKTNIRVSLSMRELGFEQLVRSTFPLLGVNPYIFVLLNRDKYVRVLQVNPRTPLALLAARREFTRGPNSRSCIYIMPEKVSPMDSV